ncbi:MAG: GTP-binding protein, partial [Candidatus Thorarchaeota archaeon]|nr:GTP-binding protein [Candidatus Thorarchaeota archaeon]
MTTEEPDFVYKLVFLGDSGVGKTSLVQRYVYDSLSSDFGQTLGAILHVKTIKFDGNLYKLIVWDLGGQEYFAALREQYCANASGAFFVWDRSRPETLGSIDRWLEPLYSSAGEVPVIVVENKIDLDPVFKPAQVEPEINSRNLKLMHTSATENLNV